MITTLSGALRAIAKADNLAALRVVELKLLRMSWLNVDQVKQAFTTKLELLKRADRSMTSNQVVLASLEHAYRNRDCG